MYRLGGAGRTSICRKLREIWTTLTYSTAVVVAGFGLALSVSSNFG